jgi:hypothetical protein
MTLGEEDISRKLATAANAFLTHLFYLLEMFQACYATVMSMPAVYLMLWERR